MSLLSWPYLVSQFLVACIYTEVLTLQNHQGLAMSSVIM